MVIDDDAVEDHPQRRRDDEAPWWKTVSPPQMIAYVIQIGILVLYMNAQTNKVEQQMQQFQNDVAVLKLQIERIDRDGPVRLQVYEAETRQILKQIAQQLERMDKKLEAK